MNNPDVKYEVNDNKLKFFNYHEYLTKDYKPLEPTDVEKSVVITHFMNNHVSKDSLAFKTTRIIRIPRTFETQYPDLVPQFSTIIPGEEPAAIQTPDQTNFQPVGECNDQKYGDTSMTPLLNYIDRESLKSIIETVNQYLVRAYHPSGINAFESMIDIFTGTLYTKILTIFTDTYSKRQLKSMNAYINTVNEDSTVKFYSPVTTGFTSVRNQVG
ncbi:ras modification protein Erf4p [[Candida] jaroonii]|uniref:Ras modification protein Erf4p n=1 Tax=[Candida] jaroonii TaxID=467808 RepID=A0ACA9YER0_9ASCO|nr:ras modification protein Erf4p [[Candida] jaroonii]